MTSPDRSAAFTVLLEWPEFATLDQAGPDGDLATLVLSDFVDLVHQEWSGGDPQGMFEWYLEYRRRITANETTEPGVLRRYALTLKAGQERRARS